MVNKKNKVATSENEELGVAEALIGSTLSLK